MTTKEEYLQRGQELYDYYEGAITSDVIAEILMIGDVHVLESIEKEPVISDEDIKIIGTFSSMHPERVSALLGVFGMYCYRKAEQIKSLIGETK